ncbi:S-4TM family putative pore-forming effector [Streptomyces sp. NPDC057474]|uniref:S-4TM family putative pore-forming effector n=1 Tax=Streptomyces sp. NPDC057474 TaxID=3346144 RepID=UPI0036CC8430
MRGTPAASILTRQNSPEMLLLLRAATTSHRRAQRLVSAHLAVSVLLAGTATLGVFVPAMQTPVTLAGFVWAVVHVVGAPAWTAPELRRAALVQEMFDVRLFGIEWNQVLAGSPPPGHEVSRVARRYRGAESRLYDYYEIDEMDELDHPLDVLACQLQNLGWGARVRRRYAATVLAFLAVWSATGVGVAAARSMSVAELLLQWFVPSLGLLLTGMDIVITQRDTATAREHTQAVLLERIHTYASRGAPAADVPQLLFLARQIQDVLLSTRLRQTRVPNWFFRPFQSSDRADFAVAQQDMRRLVSGATTPSLPDPG